MAINLVIAVTDGDWFEMLRQQPNLAEVNFWAPSAAKFRALQPGEMFLFKLHAPRNVIVGGNAAEYPPDNFFPPSLDAVGFVGRRTWNFRLGPASTFKRASTDRRDLGADIDAMHALVETLAESANGDGKVQREGR